MSRRTWTLLIAGLLCAGLTVMVLLTPLLMVSGLMASASSAACAATASTIPVTGVAGEWTSPVSGRLSSPFGMRVHPITGVRKLHDGQDIAAAYGTVVVAAAAGTGTVAASAWAGSHMVTIDHGGGVQTVYGHMSAALVVSGQQVVAGQPIGRVGSEGLSTGPHLHVIVRVNGHPIDPVPFFAQQHVTLGSAPGTAGATPEPTGQTLPVSSTHGQLPAQWSATSADGARVTLDRIQLGWAVVFAEQGASMGVPDAGVLIAFMTVFTESGWRNYANRVYPQTLPLRYPDTAVGSDHDSVGLTQARPAAGWGTPTALMDPAIAAAAFYGGPEGPNHGSPRGLLDIPRWQSLDPGAAAQAVQVSAFPDRYAAWQAPARALLALIRGTGAVEPASMACVYASAGTPGAFRAATLNLLGDSHTDRGGAAAGWAPGPSRIPGQMAALAAADVSIAGVQELQRPQHEAITRDYADSWALFPDQPGTAQNAVMWRTADWQLVPGTARTFTIPYFDGHPANQALVQLQNRGTGQRLWVISVHNPADLPTHPNQGRYRARALQIELELIKELQGTGLPVLLTGDFNDDDPPHCTFTPLMANAYGRGHTRPCRAPDKTGIDQIFLLGPATLTDTIKDRSLTLRELTDHPLVTTTIQLAAPEPTAAAA